VLGASVLSLMLLWALVARVLAADRGIDLTDESLYLLDADPPRQYDAFAFPYGWITGPLFRSVGHDIARFRTVGGVILVLATGLLAHQVLRSVEALSGRPSALGAPASRHALLVGLLSGSGLLYYVGLPLLRTPSYNWLNLIGILVALAGAFRLLHSTSPVPAAGLVAAGAFLSVHAKPTTPFLLAVAAALLLIRTKGTRTTLVFFGWAAGFSGALLALAWLSPLWPAEPITAFLRAVRIPSASTGHDPLNAVRLIVLSPLELARRALLGQPHWLVGPTLVILLAPTLANLAARPPIRRPLAFWSGRVLIVGLASVGASLVFAPDAAVAWIHGGGLGPLSDRLMPGRLAWPVDGYGTQWAPLMRIMGWLVMAPVIAAWRMPPTRALRIGAALLIVLGLISSGLMRPIGLTGAGPIVGLVQLGGAWLLIERATSAGGHRDRWSALAVLAAGVGAYAFGHDTGPVNAMPAASMIGVIALVLLIATSASETHARLVRVSTTGMMTGAAALLLTVTLVGLGSAWDEPYRSAPIRSQTVAIPFGPNGAFLRLEPALAGYLGELSAGAESGGWEAGGRLYGLHVGWTTGLTYALAAEAPPSMQQFLGRGPAGLDRLAFNLANDDLAGWEEAWLLLPDFGLRPEDGIEPEELEAVRAGVRAFAERVGMSWPDDYELVWTAPEDAPLGTQTRVTLWRPKER
jgi:hypothetical protein